MRPLRLEIEGLTSFRSSQLVDFSELDLFVITGPTGSGKTSILDAVTLALYGNVPRTTKHELRELISIGASQAKVQLDFQVGSTVYRVARRLPKNGAQAATVERLEEDRAIPEVDGSGVRVANKRIEDIVGLDYDAFTRAVLLPQGAFAEFLSGDASKRRDILIRLLDLDRFIRAGKLANEEARKLGQEVAVRAELLEREYADVDPEALEEMEKRAEQSEKGAESVEAANRGAKEHWEERREAGRRVAAIRDIAGQLAEHASELDKLAGMWSDLAEKDAETAAALEEAKEKREAAQEAYRSARASWAQLTEELGDQALLAELAGAADALIESEAWIEQATSELAEAEVHRQKLADERRCFAERLEATRAFEDAAKAAADESALAASSAREICERANQRALLARQRGREREREASLRADLKEAQLLVESLSERSEEATNRLESLETENKADAIRSHLHIGDDCPVCGSKIRLFPETRAGAESGLETARAARQQSDRRLREAEKGVSAREGTIEEVVSNIQRIEDELKRLRDVGPLADAEEALKAAEAAERTAQESLQAATEEASQALSDLGDHDKKLAQVEVQISERRGRLSETSAQADRCQAQLAEALGEPSPHECLKVVADRRKHSETAASFLAATEAALDDAREVFETASSARTAIESTLLDFDGRVRSERTRLNDRSNALSQYIEEQLDEPPPDKPGDRGITLARQTEYRETLEQTATHGLAEGEREIEELDSSLTDLLAGIEVENIELSDALEALDKMAGQARVEAAQSKSSAQFLRERLARKQEMSEGLTKKRSRMRLFAKVGRELRKDRFINFLLEESFQDLAVRASDELKLISGSHYSLGAAGDNFEVVDHMNADERRSVVTLSGGETFLASLALALALSQGITDIAGHSASARLDSMFIDEGFGSLDSNALGLVVEALERLLEGERMVGVITHVPALAERIPDGFAVEKGEAGSVVEMR